MLPDRLKNASTIITCYVQFDQIKRNDFVTFAAETFAHYLDSSAYHLDSFAYHLDSSAYNLNSSAYHLDYSAYHLDFFAHYKFSPLTVSRVIYTTIYISVIRRYV